MEKLKKTKSYFTIKEKRHQKTDDGTIFERDYMTLNSLGDWAGKTFPYGDGNFKMLTGDKYNITRKHNFGKWVRNEDGEIVWNAEDLDKVSQGNNIQDSDNIRTNPNKTSLLSFAYYGSCVEAVKNTITSIIKKFPGELYVQQPFQDDEDEILNGKCLVENPFGIDIISDSGKDDPFKSFADSSEFFEVKDNSGNTVGDVKWSVEHTEGINLKCLKHGDIINTVTILNDFKIRETYYNGSRILLAENEYQGYHIRPKQDFIAKLFDEYTDLEKILINFDTKPLYTATLDYPHEDEETGKIITYQKKFSWPTTIGGWNLDIETSRYDKYLSGILDIASFYDEYYTDNIWRSMTHDAIKNMDGTFVEDNIDSDAYNEGISRIEALLHSYGHFFDGFKFTIDSLKNRNTLTYNGDNNAPDFFLYDLNEKSGWDTSDPVSTLENKETGKLDFNGLNQSFTKADAQKQFLTSLKLNSKSILSKKGTRRGIEELLSLFGLESEDHDKGNGDYSITEYVTVLKPNANSDFVVPAEESFPIEEYNMLKISYPYSTDGYYEDTLEGLPVKIVYNKDKKYLIPWFFTGSTIDGEPYFQMYGGWGKRYSKDVETENGTVTLVNGIFEETEKYLNYATSTDALEAILADKVRTRDIYYVADISDFKEASDEPDNVSNYFMCIDENEVGSLEKGWVNIPLKDIDAGQLNGIKVLYLENIIDEIKGNNPHVGFGNYDDGSEYYKIFKQLFRYSIRNDNFNDGAYICEENRLEDVILQAGFDGAEKLIKDNAKCWYFKPNEKREGKVKLVCPDCAEKETNVGKGKYDDGTMFLSSDLEPFDYETGEVSSREMASYSVMNTKRMEIHFNVEKFGNDEKLIESYKKYINEDVLPYLKQMIPSTTIWWLKIGDEEFKAEINAVNSIKQPKRYMAEGIILNSELDGGNIKTFKKKTRKKISSLVDLL